MPDKCLDCPAPSADTDGFIVSGPGGVPRADSAGSSASEGPFAKEAPQTGHLVIMGTLGADGNPGSLPDVPKVGWAYVAEDPGTYGGVSATEGDIVYCMSLNPVKWGVLQADSDDSGRDLVSVSASFGCDPSPVLSLTSTAASGEEAVQEVDMSCLSTDWKLTAAGSTTGRTLPERFADVVNVKDFGVTGDGETGGTTHQPWYHGTDEVLSIQAAIDACAERGGGYVYFPTGVYMIGSTLHLKSNVVLVGDGPSATILSKITPSSSNSSLFNSWTDYDLLDAKGTASTIADHIKRCGIVGLCLTSNITDGPSTVMARRQIAALSNGDPDPICAALSIAKCSYFLSENCVVSGRGRGVYMEETFDSRFINTDIGMTGCLYDGVNYDSTAAEAVANGYYDSPAIEMKNVQPTESGAGVVTGTVNNIYFYGCRVETYCNTAVKIPHGDGQCNVIHFTDCKFESHQNLYHSTIDLWYAFDFAMEHCLVEDDTRNRTYTFKLNMVRTSNFNVYLVIQKSENRKRDISSFRCIVCHGCTFNLRCGSSLDNTGDFVAAGVALIDPSDIGYFENNNTVNINPKTDGFDQIRGSGFSEVIAAEELVLRSASGINGLRLVNTSLPQSWYFGDLYSIGGGRVACTIGYFDSENVRHAELAFNDSGVYPGESGTYYLGSQSLMWRSIYGNTIYAASNILPLEDSVLNIGGPTLKIDDIYCAKGHFDILYSPAATSSTAGLMSAADKAKLDSVGTVFTFKGAVADSSALPASGNTIGDAYAVEDTGTVSVWDGTAWADLGQWDGMVPATDAQIDALFAA